MHRKPRTPMGIRSAVWRIAVIFTAIWGFLVGFQAGSGIFMYGGLRNAGVTLVGRCGPHAGLEIWGHPGFFNPCTAQ